MSVLFKVVGFGLYATIFFYVTNSVSRYPEETLTTAFFKCLPILHLILIVLSTYAEEISKPQPFFKYRRLILVGLLFSLCGDVLLVWKVDLFIPGLLMFAVAHVFYMSAFGFKPFGKFALVLSSIPGICVYTYLFEAIDDKLMAGLVFLYSCLIFGVLWRAMVYVQVNRTAGSWLALFGIILFASSDLLIAIEKWRFQVAYAHFKLMILYYAAQLGITLSVHFFIDADTAKKQK